MLKVENIEKLFKKGWLFKSESRVRALGKMEIGDNQIVGLTGESGCGKTTLGLVMAGLLRPDKGDVRFGDRNPYSTPRMNKKAYAKSVQIVFQHPETAFNPRWRLKRSMMEPMAIHKIADPETQIKKIPERIGLSPSVLDRRPSQLSGGELQRLAIARALSLKPSVLILDEPTSMLDLITQARILSLLNEFKRQHRTAYVLISHGMDLLAAFCDYTVVLEKGRLRRTGQAADG